MQPRALGERSISYGDHLVTVATRGATVRSYVAGGRELLDGDPPGAPTTAGRGHTLIPWPNRVRDGRYEWDGVTHQTPVTEPARGSALHGLVREVDWDILEHTPERISLGYLLRPQPGYPFTLDARVSYALGPEGLTVTTTAHNAGDSSLPYATGHHPYLLAPTGSLDTCTLEVPAAVFVGTDERLLPTAVVPVDGTPLDLRAGPSIGALALDTAFGALSREQDGRAWARLRGPDGTGAAVWQDEAYGWLQLYTGDDLPEIHRRRRGIAVEPMTAPPDAFNSGTDLLRLEPGATTSASWGIAPLS